MRDDDFIDPKAARHARRQAKLARAAQAVEDAVYQSLMAHSGGRAWMGDLLERCHIFQPSYTGEAMSTAFKEGERNIGLQILSGIMRACPDAYVTMMKEKNNVRHDPVLDRRDADDDRNYDEADRWVGDGDDPRAEANG